MRIKIEPYQDGYRLTINEWGINATFKTYDGAVRVVNAIVAESFLPDPVVVIDYSACVEGGVLDA